MNTTIRLMQAPSEPMPELAAFLDPFRVQFARSEGPTRCLLRTVVILPGRGWTGVG